MSGKMSSEIFAGMIIDSPFSLLGLPFSLISLLSFWGRDLSKGRNTTHDKSISAVMICLLLLGLGSIKGRKVKGMWADIIDTEELVRGGLARSESRDWTFLGSSFNMDSASIQRTWHEDILSTMANRQAFAEVECTMTHQTRLIETRNGKCYIQLTKDQGRIFGAFVRQARNVAPTLDFGVRYVAQLSVWEAGLKFWLMLNIALCHLFPGYRTALLMPPGNVLGAPCLRDHATQTDAPDGPTEHRKRAR